MALESHMQSLSVDNPSGTLQLEHAFSIQPERVARLLVVADITDGILRSADSILDILAFRLTCRLARRAADVYTNRAYDIDRSLLHFFEDPAGFRQMQADTGTVISGSFAIQFFERVFYPEADLDLYTHPGFALSAGVWLYKEGYRLMNCSRDGGQTEVLDWRGAHHNNFTGPGMLEATLSENDYFNGRVSNVYTWHKATKGLPLVVQVIQCYHSPVHAIMGFHCSASHHLDILWNVTLNKP